MVHILGFLPGLFPYYYTDPNSNTRRNYSNVLSSDLSRNQFYIITPTVKSYVQQYFGCYDGTGGLLDTRSASHWDATVYKDELMTPSTRTAGLRITELTLALLWDTGFYDSVDFNLSEPTWWGYGKGCGFARGNIGNEDQCFENTCDYYSKYVRSCFAGENAIPNRICEDDIQGIGRSSKPNSNDFIFSVPSPSSLNNYEFYGYLSRCFRLANGQYPRCYKGACTISGK